MELWQAAVLGVVQGLTEFLPISSSGHLVLGQRLLGFTEPALMFDIAVHVGSLVAVVGVFWRDLWSILRGLFVWDDEQSSQGRRLLWLVVVGSIPTAIIGFAFKDLFESMFSSLLTVGLALLITGWLLLATALVRRPGRPLKKVGAGRALVIGLAQGLAITPGISRSGSTISIALLLGVNRRVAGPLLLRDVHTGHPGGLAVAGARVGRAQRRPGGAHDHGLHHRRGQRLLGPEDAP